MPQGGAFEKRCTSLSRGAPSVVFRSPFADKGVPDAVREPLGRPLRPRSLHGPISGWPGSSARSAGGFCFSPAGGRVRSPRMPMACPIRMVAPCCCSSSGAIAMRGAGSTYNDIVDRDLDAQVARTPRPAAAPSGRVSLKGALVFVLFLCLVGLVVLLQFNSFTIMLGFASLGIVMLLSFRQTLRLDAADRARSVVFRLGRADRLRRAIFGYLAWPAILLYCRRHLLDDRL